MVSLQPVSTEGHLRGVVGLLWKREPPGSVTTERYAIRTPAVASNAKPMRPITSLYYGNRNMEPGRLVFSYDHILCLFISQGDGMDKCTAKTKKAFSFHRFSYCCIDSSSIAVVFCPLDIQSCSFPPSSF